MTAGSTVANSSRPECRGPPGGYNGGYNGGSYPAPGQSDYGVDINSPAAQPPEYSQAPQYPQQSYPQQQQPAHGTQPPDYDQPIRPAPPQSASPPVSQQPQIQQPSTVIQPTPHPTTTVPTSVPTSTPPVQPTVPPATSAEGGERHAARSGRQTTVPGTMSRTDRAPRWLVLLVVLTVLALGCAVLGTRGPAVAVYASADFTHLPAATDGCASIHQVGDSKELVEQACGSSASTFRVIGRVGESSQCVGDADLIYTWSSQMLSGAVCLDYDWTPGQCMLITPDTAAKSDCADSASVRPDGGDHRSC